MLCSICNKEIFPTVGQVWNGYGTKYIATKNGITTWNWTVGKSYPTI